jgi:hypothetical protein
MSSSRPLAAGQKERDSVTAFLLGDGHLRKVDRKLFANNTTNENEDDVESRETNDSNSSPYSNFSPYQESINHQRLAYSRFLDNLFNIEHLMDMPLSIISGATSINAD